MHTKTLLFAALTIASRVLAQEIENEDVPSQCRDICANTLAVSDRCNSGDDDVELQCICTSSNAMSDIPNCEACVAEFDENDNNVRDIVESCSFTIAATFTTPGASSTAQMSTTSAGASTTAATTATASRVSVVTSVVTTGGQTGATQSSGEEDDNNEANTTTGSGGNGNTATGMAIPALAVLGAAVLGAAALL